MVKEIKPQFVWVPKEFAEDSNLVNNIMNVKNRYVCVDGYGFFKLVDKYNYNKFSWWRKILYKITVKQW